MQLTVTGIYYADSLIWLAGRIRNRAVPDFAVEQVRLFTQDRKRVKRMALQEMEIVPVFSDVNAAVIPGGAKRKFVIGYRGVTVPDHKRLVLEIADRGGLRVIQVRIPAKKLLSAMRRIG